MATREISKKTMIGKRFGKLTVIEFAGVSKNRKLMWICKCDCGKITHPIVGSNLRSGQTKSCGCFCVEISKRNRTHLAEYAKHSAITAKHDYIKHKRLYGVWQGMKQRCYYEKHKQFADYGGRGIIICDEWKNSFELFCKWALENGYDENAEYGQCTLDRIDVNGNYEPSNCRWVSMAVQIQNRRI